MQGSSLEYKWDMQNLSVRLSYARVPGKVLAYLGPLLFSVAGAVADEAESNQPLLSTHKLRSLEGSHLADGCRTGSAESNSLADHVCGWLKGRSNCRKAGAVVDDEWTPLGLYVKQWHHGPGVRVG